MSSPELELAMLEGLAAAVGSVDFGLCSGAGVTGGKVGATVGGERLDDGEAEVV